MGYAQHCMLLNDVNALPQTWYVLDLYANHPKVTFEKGVDSSNGHFLQILQFIIQAIVINDNKW